MQVFCDRFHRIICERIFEKVLKKKCQLNFREKQKNWDDTKHGKHGSTKMAQEISLLKSEDKEDDPNLQDKLAKETIYLKWSTLKC